jgi:hypothetical protein
VQAARALRYDAAFVLGTLFPWMFAVACFLDWRDAQKKKQITQEDVVMIA